MLRADLVFRVSAVIAILYYKGYDLQRMLSLTKGLCMARTFRYGTRSDMIMRSIEGRLHAILDDTSDTLYMLIEDPKSRVRTVIRDLILA